MFGFGRKKIKDPVAGAYDPNDPLIAQAVQDLEAYLAADFDGDGKVAGQTPDPVAQLERVAALHAAGKLTDAEFQNLKARILG